MSRTVKVELSADVADYVAGVLEADEATKKLDKKVEDLDGDLKKIPADATKAAAGLETLSGAAKDLDDDYKGTAKSVEDFGKKTESAGESTKSMRTRMDELEASLKKTGAEFAKNADPELLKKFKTDSSQLRGLESMVGKMEKLGINVEQFGLQAEKAGGEAEGLLGKLGIGGPEGAVLGAGIAIPALAAAGGALTGLIGIGGAGAGVVAAVMGNPQAFQAAWGAAAGEVKKDFLDAGNAFVGPTMKAIESIGPLVDSWHLDKALAPAAKYLPEIVQGLEGAATGLEHGLADAIGKAEPAVSALSQGMKDLGQAGGTALSEIADGAQGGADALHDVVTAVSYVVVGFGAITEAAEKAYGFVKEHPIEAAIATGGLSIGASAWSAAMGNVTDGEKTLASVLPGTDLALQAQATDLAALTEKLKAADNTMDKFVGTQVTKALNSILSLDQATLSFNQSLLSVSDSFKQNGRSLDEHTRKGAANVAVVLSAVQANIATYKSNIEANMGAEQAAAAYDAGTAALERQLRQAHLTQGQIDGLVGKYRGIPKQVDTDIVLHGLEEAINNLNTTLRLINNIHDKNVTIGVTTVYHTKGSPNVGEGGTQVLKGAYAEGGDPPAGWSLVGEKGPELVHFSGGEHVYTAAQTRSMMAPAAAGWGGGGSVAVQLSLSTAAASDTAVGALFNNLIRNGYVVVKQSQVRAA